MSEGLMDMSDRTLRTAVQLSAAGLIQESDIADITRVAGSFAVAISPQMRALIDPRAPNDPIAAQFVPSSLEVNQAPEELDDPIGDESHSPVPGIVHRYPDRVLFKLVNVCPVYCRFCFRRETVGTEHNGLDSEALERALNYIESNAEIWEVVVSGGDPFILSSRRLARIMSRLERIPHLGVVRFHTRVPVVRPDNVDAELISALKIKKAVYVVLHTNHVQELSEASRNACAKLIDAGFPMLSQTVLLKGVNANAETLKALFRQLVEMRIKPYYLHHGDLAKGTSHFRTTIAEGQSLVRSLRAQISGLCQPTYVLDIPGGYGKVPIGPNYLSFQGSGIYSVEDNLGHSHQYVESVLP
jgi:lysine 2,3-aminomutase